MDKKNSDRLFEMYKVMLSTIDWSRDVRKKRTICSDCLKDARVALEAFDDEMKNQK